MTNLPLARLGVHVISTLGVTKVVGDIISRNAVAQTTFDVVRLKVGELVLSSMITSQTMKYVDGQIDSALSWYEGRNKAKTDLKVEN